jgi:hypothetical protein
MLKYRIQSQAMVDVTHVLLSASAARSVTPTVTYTCLTDNATVLSQVEERLRASQVGRRGRPDEVLKLHIHTHESVGSSSSDGQGFCDGSVQAGLTLKGFKKGDALLVWNMLTDGATPDAAAAHLFCTGGDQVR